MEFFCIDTAKSIPDRPADEFCENAGAGDLVFNEGSADEITIQFIHNGDDLTLSGNVEGGFDFDGPGGPGLVEPASFVITLERIDPGPDGRPPLLL